ncbi:MAG: flagellin, partial [Clostridium sp.]|nr:flagellin [Clostridium sp.]
MRINTNMNAMTALNQATKNTALAGASMEKLSSGLRINKAGDDAAGLAISEKMRSQIRGMEQASRNTQDGISLVQTAEGAMEEIGNITQRMRELSVQAASDTNQTEDRNKIQAEIKELTAQIDQIAGSTKFNGQNLLMGDGFSAAATTGKGATSVSVSKDYGVGAKITSSDDGGKLKLTITNDAGETYTQSLDVAASAKNGVLEFDKLGVKIELKAGEAVDNAQIIGTDVAITAGGATKGITIQTGANTTAFEQITINLDKADSTALGINALDVTDQTNAKAAINSLDTALEQINSSRSKLGAMQNRLEYTNSNLTSVTENLSAAESRIRDVD